MTELIVHSDEIAAFVRPTYSASDLLRLEAFLIERGVLTFRPLATGLFPAAPVDAATDKSGYHSAWVRDNVFVAHAHAANGRVDAAIGVARALAAFFAKYVSRLDAVIAGTVDRKDAMNRPHVRFDGDALVERPERWPHAQNDALGYFLWLYSGLVADDALLLTDDGFALLEKFIAYLKAIRFWEDEDSGHWEEGRKISASSIGVVVGGLEAMKAMFGTSAVRARFPSVRIGAATERVVELIGRGRRALDAILPAECVQPDPKKARRYDSALLFLIYPVNVVDDVIASRIVEAVETRLMGSFGIRRYIGDSYWCADYRALVAPEKRSADYSADIGDRDRLLKPGEEAQWCIFDPVLSMIYGKRAIGRRAAPDIQKQTDYFNRSLGQITAALQCPEAYCLERGRYAPNDDTPLLWTQANLWLALKAMKDAVVGREMK